ncbi:MAG: hypothetical protein IAC08_02015 [Bacteroidetes bacterium]|uniref:Uncharacterized protein n=1 Tax=Candidatus Cryptobacteroides intestinigallinarum TaxID=2840767 RepID=A0A9D9MZF7_9BACT|nr:hypothetical protein [Candidatus Cryptobacteroides intestinigallinarum]
MGLIAKSIRSHRLRKYSSTMQTGFTPLGSIRKALFIIDAEDPSWDRCRKEAEDFCSRHGIQAVILYSDFRKFSKEIQPRTEAGKTFRRKDIGLFKLPKMKKMRSTVLSLEPDLLVCLSPDGRFLMEFIARATKARFKIGRNIFPGDPYDLVIVPSEHNDGDDSPAENTGKTRPAHASESQATPTRTNKLKQEAIDIHVDQDKVLNKILSFLTKVEK